MILAAFASFAACSSPRTNPAGRNPGPDGSVANDSSVANGTDADSNSNSADAEAGLTGPVCTNDGGPGPNTVIVDGKGAGRTFDFIGGLSGGGGTSRLLYDYPPQQQAEILDYLFKPGYGASLQLLKVEIGADTDTTNGAEATHERTPTDRNYHRGYEWWLMGQAKLRNPNIKLYGLEWGAPGWFPGGFYSTYNIDYIVNWIENAQAVYGLTIDYIGGWNEMGYNGPWLQRLKAALVSAGLSTRLVAADAFQDLSIAVDTSGVLASVDVIGVHYPCGYLSDGMNCSALGNLQAARDLGKPLWASEEGSQPFDTGATAMARSYNRHYIQAEMTASINWSLVGSWYPNLPYSGVDGLLLANQPWSGYYAVDKEIWVTAHTTQFVQPGWQYVNRGSGIAAAGLGSYVTLKSPDGQNWSVILETAGAATVLTFNFIETGGVLAGPVHVWATNLGDPSSAGWFVQQADISPTDCGFAFAAQPNYVYTLTTTTGQGKGTTTPPLSAPLSIPYRDDFESYTVGAMPNIPKYFSTVEGAFEAENCLGGRAGTCLQQEVTEAPIPWGTAASPNPVTLVGDPSWTDYQVSVDVLGQQAGSVDLIGRITGQDEKGGGVEGYHLEVSSGGAWSLFAQNATTVDTTLASGTVSFPLNSWHTLALDLSGTTIAAMYDGATIAMVTDATYAGGSAGLSTSQWNNAQFDNFAVSPP